MEATLKKMVVHKGIQMSPNLFGDIEFSETSTTSALETKSKELPSHNYPDLETWNKAVVWSVISEHKGFLRCLLSVVRITLDHGTRMTPNDILDLASAKFAEEAVQNEMPAADTMARSLRKLHAREREEGRVFEFAPSKVYHHGMAGKTL